jgi:hypothetical protein
LSLSTSMAGSFLRRRARLENPCIHRFDWL